MSVTIESASYCGNNDTCVDVRPRIQGRLTGESKTFSCPDGNFNSIFGDPFPNVPKTLKIKLSDGRSFCWKEGEAANFSLEPVKSVTLESASYCRIDDEACIDVKTLVQNRLTGAEGTFSCPDGNFNSIFGDPFPYVVKVLKVKLSDGRSFSWKEGQAANFSLEPVKPTTLESASYCRIDDEACTDVKTWVQNRLTGAEGTFSCPDGNFNSIFGDPFPNIVKILKVKLSDGRSYEWKEGEAAKFSLVELPRAKAYYVVASGKVTAGPFEDSESARLALNEAFPNGVSSSGGSRMVACVGGDGKCTDPHNIEGTGGSNQGANKGFHKFWWDWNDINAMHRVAEEHHHHLNNNNNRRGASSAASGAAASSSSNNTKDHAINKASDKITNGSHAGKPDSDSTPWTWTIDFEDEGERCTCGYMDIDGFHFDALVSVCENFIGVNLTKSDAEWDDAQVSWDIKVYVDGDEICEDSREMSVGQLRSCGSLGTFYSTPKSQVAAGHRCVCKVSVWGGKTGISEKQVAGRAAATASPSGAAAGAVRAISSVNEFEDAIVKSGLTVVDAWATWCGPCRSAAPHYAAMAEEFASVQFLKFDVDQCRELMGKLKVTCMPTFLLFKNGTEVDRQEGWSKDGLTGMIAKHT